MSEGRGHHFAGSEQLAIEFVLRHLVNPAGARVITPPTELTNEEWPQPFWGSFTWFTKIISDPVRTIDVKESCEIVTRTIRFLLGEDVVATITMLGEREAEDLYMWRVCRVQYKCDLALLGRFAGQVIDREIPGLLYTSHAPGAATG